MPDRPLTEKQRAFTAAYYTPGSDTFGNGTESARKAQYKGNSATLQVVGAENICKPMIIAEKNRIQAQTKAKYEHTEAITILNLTTDYAYLATAAGKGNIQAIQARTAISRELNSVMGLNRTNVHTTEEQPDDITAADRAELKQVAKRMLAIRLGKETA